MSKNKSKKNDESNLPDFQSFLKNIDNMQQQNVFGMTSKMLDNFSDSQKQLANKSNPFQITDKDNIFERPSTPLDQGIQMEIPDSGKTDVSELSFTNVFDDMGVGTDIESDINNQESILRKSIDSFKDTRSDREKRIDANREYQDMVMKYPQYANIIPNQNIRKEKEMERLKREQDSLATDEKGGIKDSYDRLIELNKEKTDEYEEFKKRKSEDDLLNSKKRRMNINIKDNLERIRERYSELDK